MDDDGVPDLLNALIPNSRSFRRLWPNFLSYKGLNSRNRRRPLNVTVANWDFRFLGKLPTYPFPMLTLTLTSHLGQNDGIGEG